MVALLTAACHGDSGQAPSTPSAAHAKNAPVAPKSGPTPEELTAGMVEAVTIGKSTVPIAVKFDLPSRPVVGQPLEVDVAVLPQIAGTATLQVTSTSGLELAPGVGRVEIPAVEPTQAYRVRIAALPTADGVQLLDVAVSLNHEDTTDTRSFAVPIIVLASAVPTPVPPPAPAPRQTATTKR
jgi:hypothetical protein